MIPVGTVLADRPSMRSGPKAAIALAAALATTLMPLASHAAPSQSQASATARFDEGRTLFKAGKFTEACTAFEQSQELDPANGTLYNLAGCYVKIGKLASAWAAYRELAERDTNAQRKVDSERQARALTPRLPKLVITAPGAPADLLVQLNGLDVTRVLGIDNPIDLGTHEVVARATGYAELRIPVEVTAEGKTVPVTIKLTPLSPTATGEPPDLTSTPPAGQVDPGPDIQPAPHSKLKLIGAATTIGGAAVLTVGILYGLKASSSWSKAQDLCGSDDNICDHPSSLPRANTLSTDASKQARWSTVFTSLGVAAIAAGIVLYVTAPSGEHAIHLTPGAGGSPAGVSLGGSF